MKKNVIAVVLCSALLTMSINCHAENWVKNDFDIPNKNAEANFYDADSVKVHSKTLSWTEKFTLTAFGATNYTKHLSQYPICKKNIASKGEVTYHQMDLEIKGGKSRIVAKRNYNKDNVVVCTDQDMGNELDKAWHEIVFKSPMYERYYMLATKYKIGDL